MEVRMSCRDYPCPVCGHFPFVDCEHFKRPRTKKRVDTLLENKQQDADDCSRCTRLDTGKPPMH
jgi:hypothetical protein